MQILRCLAWRQNARSSHLPRMLGQRSPLNCRGSTIHFDCKAINQIIPWQLVLVVAVKRQSNVVTAGMTKLEGLDARNVRVAAISTAPPAMQKGGWKPSRRICRDFRCINWARYKTMNATCVGRFAFRRIATPLRLVAAFLIHHLAPQGMSSFVLAICPPTSPLLASHEREHCHAKDF